MCDVQDMTRVSGHIPDITGPVPDSTGHILDITGPILDITGPIPGINFMRQKSPENNQKRPKTVKEGHLY